MGMVKKWVNSTMDIGVLKPKQKYNLVFACLESLDDVLYITTSCGCSKAKRVDNTIQVDFNTGKFPIHLEVSGIKENNFKRTINVYYKSGKVDGLTFYGKVVL